MFTEYLTRAREVFRRERRR